MGKHMQGRNVAAPQRTLAQAIARMMFNTRPEETQRFEFLEHMIESNNVPRFQVLWALFEISEEGLTESAA